MTKQTMIMDGLQSTVAALGTERDKGSTVSYVEVEIPDEQLTAAYKTSWLAKKIVDIPATDTFRRWRNWQAEEDQIEKLENLEKKLGLKEKFLKAYKLARLYGCCYAYFDLGDDPTKPVDPSKVKAGGLRFVTVLSHRQLSPGELEQDALSDNFGKPKWFDVVSATEKGFVRIHASRVIVFLGVQSPDDNLLVGTREGYGFRMGSSVLSSTLEAVKHFDAVSANISSLTYEAKIDVISVKGLMSIVGNPYEERKLLDRYRLAAITKGNNGMLILDGDTEEYTQKSSSFASLADIMDRFSQNACGAADIPLSRLFGKTHGGIGSSGAGETDVRNYYDFLSGHQELEIRPALEIFDECLIYAALGSRPEEVHYLWASLWQVSDKERSELGRVGVATIKTLKDTGLIPDEVLSRGAVNLLTQAGVIPGLEAEYDAYFEDGGEAPWDIEAEKEEAAAEAEAKVAMATAKAAGAAKPAAKVVADAEQPRAPKGTPNGGQWIESEKNGGFGSRQIEKFSYGFRDNPLPVWPISRREISGNKFLTKKWDASFKDAVLDPANLLTIQGQVEEHVTSGLNWEDLPPIKVVKVKDKYVILDGNHRAASLWLDGGRKIKARLLDLDDPANASLRNETGISQLSTPPATAAESMGLKVSDSHFEDEQPRAPKGTPNGGQWVKEQGSFGGLPNRAGTRAELKALVESGADRSLIDSHIALLSVLEEMQQRESTTEKEGYGTEEWHKTRLYTIEGKKIIGTETALEAWEEQAATLGWKELGKEPEPIAYERNATILLGPPAAGKSTIANEIAVARKAMILDSDEIKKSLKEFAGGSGASAVHEESSQLAKTLQALVIAKGANVILPKVGDSPESIKKLIKQYKDAGYKVNLVNMAVTTDNAYRRNISRFVNTGRIVPPAYLDSVGDKPSSTYKLLRQTFAADGFAEIDNNGGYNDPKPVTDVYGGNPLEGTRFAAQMK